jgi:hypothetical protein
MFPLARRHGSGQSAFVVHAFGGIGQLTAKFVHDKLAKVDNPPLITFVTVDTDADLENWSTNCIRLGMPASRIRKVIDNHEKPEYGPDVSAVVSQ